MTRRALITSSVLSSFVAALFLFVAIVPTGRYLARAGWEEARILAHRQRIDRLADDPSLDPRVRGKLQLVLDARRFARDSLGMRTGESYTTFATVPRDTLVLVVSAAYRDRLERYTWWFPIVGRVPYKGFFDFAAARSLVRDLQRDGFDAYARPASAFSTLGWFNDPLLSTSLRADSVDLAGTVIHELTHTTFYASGQAVFNESFAEFTGARGSARFFRARGDSAAALLTERRWADEKVLADFYHAVYASLDSAFRAHPESRAARLSARDSVFSRARARFATSVWPLLSTSHGRPPPTLRLDNAIVLARRVYATDLELFDVLLRVEEGDVRRSVRRVIALASAHPGHPFRAVAEWLERSRSSLTAEDGVYLEQWLAAHPSPGTRAP
ncbi:MAG: aminopeptidase [Gemmatimonadota bacterium]|nr:aminopeptidase [Gemmatimonadota bacterium]